MSDVAADIVEGVRARWPDAPADLVELVAARVILLAVVRKWNLARIAFDAATRAYFQSRGTRLGRLQLAVECERAAEAASGWSDALIVACRLTASKRERYGAWMARRQRAAELAGRDPDPAYVLPESRGDAWERPKGTLEFFPGERWDADTSVFMLRARATLRIWSRYYALHTPATD